MATISVNGSPVLVQRGPNVVPVDLSNQTSLVANVTVEFPSPVESPAFTLSPRAGVTKLSGPTNPSTAAVTVTAAPTFGAGFGRRFTLTFSGAGAPNGTLKDGVYNLVYESETVAVIAVLFGSRVPSDLPENKDGLVVDSQQASLGALSLGASLGAGGLPSYSPGLDANLDGEIDSADNFALAQRVGTRWEW